MANVRGQLTRAKNEQLNFFGYGFIVVSVSLERIPMLAPQRIPVDVVLPREPRIVRWVTLMARHREEGTEVV